MSDNHEVQSLILTPIESNTTPKLSKKHVLDWSIEELLLYKQSGIKPVRILDECILFNLGKSGATIAMAAQVLEVHPSEIVGSPTLFKAYKKGKGELGIKVRSMLVDRAFEGDTKALVYLDRAINGRQV